MTALQITAFLQSAETGAITDAMKLLGLEGWMDDILPLAPDSRICGRAFTLQYERNPGPGKTVLNIFEVMDRASAGDVMVLSVPSDGAIVGENIMCALLGHDVNGMVLDGKARDTGIIRREHMPLFCRGPAIRLETDCKITAAQVPVTCGGVLVQPGDYIVGDCDGVICVPAAEAEQLIYQTERIAKIEVELEHAIKNGFSMRRVAEISSQKKSLRVAMKG